MAKIWINEEMANPDGNIGIHGEIQTIYGVFEISEETYLTRNRRFLQSFLDEQVRYPFLIHFITEADGIKEKFDMLAIDYKMDTLELARGYWREGKLASNCPVLSYYQVEIKDVDILQFVLKETFFIAEQNEFYAISFAEDLSLTVGTHTHIHQGRTTIRKFPLPLFTATAATTFLTMAHDGDGFYLFTNEDKYSTVEKLCVQLPKGTKIEQINETLIEDNCNIGSWAVSD